MRKFIITTPRVGGTAYSKWYAEQNNLLFINEPFIQIPFVDKNTGVSVGYKSLDQLLNYNDNVVVHTQVLDLLEFCDIQLFPQPDEIIFIERRDKWKQLLSFCIMRALIDRYGFHNIHFEKDIEIVVDMHRVTYMIDSWVTFDLTKQVFVESPIIYYEDMIFPNNFQFKKTAGYDHIKILNIEDIISRFENIYRLKK